MPALLIFFVIIFTAFIIWKCSAVRHVIGVVLAWLAGLFCGALSWFGRVIPLFWHWLGRQIRILLTISGAIFLMIAFGIGLQWRGLISLGFILAVIFYFSVWTIVGSGKWLLESGLKAVGANVEPTVYPPFVPYVVFWLCTFGLLGTLHPVTSSRWIFISSFLLISGLIAAFGAMIGHKSKTFNVIALVLVLGMVAVYSVKEATPNFYHAQERHIGSTAKSVFSWQHQKSVKNETDAATTWGIAKKEVKNFYRANFLETGEIKSFDLFGEGVEPISEGEVVQVLRPDEELKIFEGQAYIEIKLPDRSQEFGPNSKKRWVAANLFDWGEHVKVVPGEYSVVTHKQTMRVNFYSDNPLKIFDWKKGEEVVFTNGTEGCVFMNSPNISEREQEYIPLPLNFPMIATSDLSIIIKYQKGGILYINKTSKKS